jgi:hypothetical protein
MSKIGTIEDEPQPLVLTTNDKQSGTWLKLEDYLQQELGKYRKKNDGLLLDEIQTAVIRGRIATLKSLLLLGEDTSPGVPLDG